MFRTRCACGPAGRDLAENACCGSPISQCVRDSDHRCIGVFAAGLHVHRSPRLRKVLQTTGPRRQRMHYSPSKHTVDYIVRRAGASAFDI